MCLNREAANQELVKVVKSKCTSPLPICITSQFFNFKFSNWFTGR